MKPGKRSSARVVLSLFLISLFAWSACEPEGDDETLEQVEQASTCRSVVLYAWRDATQSPEIVTDAEQMLAPKLTFRLPEAVGLAGGAPSDSVIFSYDSSAGISSCTYTFTGTEEYYSFVECEDGREPNDLVTAGWVRLHINAPSSTTYPAGAYIEFLEEAPCLGDCALADDNDPNTIDLCDPVTGVVTHKPLPPLDLGVATTVGDALAGLHEGIDPVQVGVDPGALDPVSAAAIIGHVYDGSGSPLIGAKVNIVGQDGLGYTTTDLQGRYVMRVNGGAPITVNVEAPPLLPSQRTVQTHWQTYSHVPDIMLVSLEPTATTIDFAAITDVAVAEGSVVSDDDGPRQVIVMFEAGTTATLVTPTGDIPVSELTLRLTEYTVGADGPARMPGSLAPQTAYTYAFELSADEAIAAGATSVRLGTVGAPDRASIFVDNFVDAPVGTAVPIGAYDREAGVWVPSDDGHVLEIVGVSGGIAAIDLDGDGFADPLLYDQFGLSDEEREELATRYPVGTTLMHGEVTHFTPYDLNFPPRVDPASCYPLLCDEDDPEFWLGGNEDDNPCTRPGSIIECTNQALGEAVPLTGTPHSLHYQSNRARGAGRRSVTIPVSGPWLPPNLESMLVRLEVAGQVIQAYYTPQTNKTVTFTWDGTDVFGRPVNGLQPAKVTVGYVYPILFAGVSVGSGSFGVPRSFGSMVGIQEWGYATRTSAIFTTHDWVTLGTWENNVHALGGFSLDAVHAYDVLGRSLQRGDGTRRHDDEGILKALRSTQVSYGTMRGLATDTDGSLVALLDGGGTNVNRLVRWAADGSESILATSAGGTGCTPLVSETGLFSSCLLQPGADRIIIPAGNGIYYIFGWPYIVRVDLAAGVIRHIAGVNPGSTAENIPATEAALHASAKIALAPDGSLYMSHFLTNNRYAVRRIGPDGTIATVSSLTVTGVVNDVHITQTGFPGAIFDLEFGPDGSLFILSGSTIRRVAPDGMIRAYAGGGNIVLCSVASQCTLEHTNEIAVDHRGIVYFDQAIYTAGIGKNGIHAIKPDGSVRLVAGNGGCSTEICGFGGPALAAVLGEVHQLHTTPSGEIRAHNNYNYIYGIEPDLAPLGTASGFLVAEDDGRTIYHFDARGRHLETLDAATGVVLHTVHYDGAGRLWKVTDVDGLETEVVRNGSGDALYLEGPYGHRTYLDYDANGFLEEITDPLGSSWSATYDTAGLMLSWTDRDKRITSFGWADGRLVSHVHPGSGQMTFSGTFAPFKTTVQETTPLGRTTQYELGYVNRNEQRKTTSPGGIVTTSERTTAGVTTIDMPDGTVVVEEQDGDDLWGMEAPIAARTTTTLPSGLRHEVLGSRAYDLNGTPSGQFFATRTETTTINGRTWTTTLDAASTPRVEVSTSPEGRVITATLDAKGRVVEIEQTGLHPILFTYDTDGRLTNTTQGTRVTSALYGADGFVETLRNALAESTQLVRDENGRVTRIIPPNNARTRIGYDDEGHVTGLLLPSDAEHGFTINAIGAVDAYTPPNLGFPPSTSYTYDLDKALTSVDPPDGSYVDYTYEPTTGWLSAITTPTGTIQLGYDALTGKLAAMDGPTGVNLDFTYDGPFLEEIQYSGAVNGTVSWTLDQTGTNPTVTNLWVASESINAGGAVAFDYDDDGLLTSAGALTVTRDPALGRVTAATAGTITEELTYTLYGEVATRTVKHNGVPFWTVAYVYDDLGRIAERTEIDGTTTVTEYTYDNVGRLIAADGGAIDEVYEYDVNGNRVYAENAEGTFLAWYDAQDRLETYGDYGYSWDQNGDLTSVVDNTTQDTVALPTYDALGNLRTIRVANGNISYRVDGAGRRVEKELDSSTVVVQKFLWRSQLQPVAELDANDHVVARFVYAAGGNAPDLILKGGNTYRVLKDHVGSVRKVVNVATGAVAQSIEYDSFGIVLHDSNPGFQPFGFAGGLYDPDTGWVRFGARDYDPFTGRWTTKDPIRFDGGTNLYQYAEDDPINGADPTGLRPLRPTLIAWEWGRKGTGRPTNPFGRVLDETVRNAVDEGMAAVGRKQCDLRSSRKQRCLKESLKCSAYCESFLGENWRPGRRRGPRGGRARPGGGTNTQFKYTTCYKDCMRDAGC